MGGLKSATVPPRIRSGLGRTCGGSARWTVSADSSGSAADSAGVRRGPKSPPRIRYGSGLSTRRSAGLFGHEKKLESAIFGELVFAAE